MAVIREEPFEDPPLGDRDLADLSAIPTFEPLNITKAVLYEDPPTTGADGGFLCAGCGARVPAVWLTVPPGRTMDDAIPECTQCHERSVKSRDEKVAAGEAEIPEPVVVPHEYVSKSGAKSSERKPAYHLVPLLALLNRVTRRFEVGRDRYGVDNWRKGIGEQDFLIERGNHALEHLVRVLGKLKDGKPSDYLDDDLAAIAWFCLVLAESESVTSTRRVTESDEESGDGR